MPQGKEPQVLIGSEKIRIAMRGYQPVMGDAQDISIRDGMSRIEKKLRLVDNKELRRLEAAGDQTKMTPKMKEILREEQNIVYQMEQRKFDF